MRENNTMNSNNHKIPLLKFIDSSIRVSVIPLSVATIWLIMTNHQDNDIYGKLSFSNLSGLKYMICIGFISGFYALFAAVSSWITCLSNKAWLFFISDQILAYLMVTSVGAVMEIMYLAYNGDKAISWSEACDTYGHFCFRIKLALIFHSFSLFCFIALAFISAFRLFSNFEPPFVPNQ